MKLSLRLGSLVFAALLAAGCNKAAAPSATAAPTNDSPQARFEAMLPKEAQAKLPTVKVWVGAEELETEVAATAVAQMTGMMWRTNMAEGTAMIFIHPTPRQASYWMKHCYVPLSIAYIDTAGTILEIRNMQPHDTNSVTSASDQVRFALETPQGWFERHNISAGANIRTDHGSLAETFLRQR